MFTQLWTILPNVISEPKLLYPAFEIAVMNGHEHFSEHLFNLYFAWHEYSIDDLMDTDNWKDSLNTIYQQWRSIDIILQEDNNNGNYSYNFQVNKFKILLKAAVISNDIQYVETLLKHQTGIRSFIKINDELSYANSRKVLDYLITFLKILSITRYLIKYWCML